MEVLYLGHYGNLVSKEEHLCVRLLVNLYIMN